VIVIRSQVALRDVSGQEITEFLLNCTHEAYQAWWPGVHLRMHMLRPGPGPDHVGDRVLMDEFIGRRRVRMSGEVVAAVPGQTITWQLRPGVRLPVRLTLELTEAVAGVEVRHTITAGWGGLGRLADPLFRLYFTRGFAAAMDEHVHTEFPLLRDRIRTS